MKKVKKWCSSALPLQMLQNCNRACYLTLPPPSGALFFFSCYPGEPLVFLGISIYSFQKNIYGSMPKKYSTNLADALCEDTLQPLNEVTALKPITSHFFSHHHDFSTSQSIPFNKDLKTVKTAQHALPVVCLKSFPISHCSFHFILFLLVLMASWHPVS